jgi:hypothetical protein
MTHWNYNAQLSDLAPDQVNADIPRGLKITKTLIDETTGQELVTVDATREDAKTNGGAGFIEDYISLAKSTYQEQLAKMLNYENGVRVPQPGSHALIFSANLRETVDTINYLLDQM